MIRPKSSWNLNRKKITHPKTIHICSLEHVYINQSVFPRFCALLVVMDADCCQAFLQILLRSPQFYQNKAFDSTRISCGVGESVVRLCECRMTDRFSEVQSLGQVMFTWTQW